MKKETTLSCSSAKVSIALEDLLASRSPVNCFEFLFSPLVEIIRHELEILVALLKLQCQLGNLEFLNSILSLNALSHKLIEDSSCQCEVSVEPRQTRLRAWLRKFYSTLLAKFTLYWYTVLNNAATSSVELEQSLSKENPDIVSKIQDFVHRYEGVYVALFFDAYLQDFAYLGHSYVPPGAAEKYVKGPIAIPCIFTMPPGSEPNTVPVPDLTVIMRAINSLIPLDASATSRQIMPLQDLHLQKSFLVLKVEARMYMAIVFPSSLDAENGHFREFATKITNTIQLVNLVRSIRN
ncbi:unnamed protein product [Mesocestoides corti]|nr:unnamed protein product [Mesocestoides corti]